MEGGGRPCYRNASQPQGTRLDLVAARGGAGGRGAGTPAPPEEAQQSLQHWPVAILPGSGIPANPEGGAGSAQVRAAQLFQVYLLLLPAPLPVHRQLDPGRGRGRGHSSSRPMQQRSAWQSDVTGAQA